MRDFEQLSAQARIVRDYFRTTSALAHRSGCINYEISTTGLRRGLRDWFDVAGKDVVDLGCGTGELCWLAKQHGARKVIGVNLSQDEIDFAGQHVKADFVHEDIVSFLSRYPEKSIDRIFALNILEHLSKDDLVRVLEGSSRCLRDGGHLIAMVPNATSPYGALTRYWDFTHQLSFTPSSVEQLARLCDFSQAEFREWGPRPHGILSAIRYLLWQGIRIAIRVRLLVEMASTKGGVYTADMQFRLVKAKRRHE